MNLCKLYFQHDWNTFGVPGFAVACTGMALAQIFLPRPAFGCTMLVLCLIMPGGMAAVLAAAKYGDLKSTEYFFSLPAPRTLFLGSAARVIAIFSLSLLGLATLIHLFDLTGIVQGIITRICQTDTYLSADNISPINFHSALLPLYLDLIWISAACGWIPYLLVGPGLRRIVIGITNLLIPAISVIWGLIVTCSGSPAGGSLIATSGSIIMVLIFLTGLNRFKKAELFY